jgi:hypothetical protein
MAFLLFLLCQILFIAGLLLLAAIMASRRHDRPLFKPLTRPGRTEAQDSAAFGMRAAADRFDARIPRIGGRRHLGSVCFVTGMPRTECTCPHCQKQRR